MTGTSTVVQFSGGLSSWESAERVAASRGTECLWLLFTDVIVEDADLYRFLIEGAAHVFSISDVADLSARAAALPLIREDKIEDRKRLLKQLSADTMVRIPHLAWIADGRTPWEVFRHERFIGNSRLDPCSKILKRNLAARWLDENCQRGSTTIYLGFGHDEQDRIASSRARYEGMGRAVEYPMDDAPLMSRVPLMQLAIDRGIKPPRLYYYGFKHNNCGGLCCKMGQAQAAKLLDVDPCLYGYGERQEESLRDLLGNVAMMKETRKRQKYPLPLTVLRERLQRDPSAFDAADVGACSCFAEPEAESEGR